MCGLAGYIRLPTVSSPPKTVEDTFINTFVTAQLRGFHSSGLAGVWRQNPVAGAGKKKRKPYYGIHYAKGLYDPYSCYQDLGDRIAEKTSKRRSTYSTPFLQVALGHCRHATIGKVTANNAHPFAFDNNRFVGTHNGTISNSRKVYAALLRDADPLPDTRTTKEDYLNATSTATDSEVVLYCIYRYGIDKVYPLIEGAWALVWYDQTTGTVNFIRNEQRPLFTYAAYVNDTLFYASERAFLEMAVKREQNNCIESKLVSLPIHTLHTYNITEDRRIVSSADPFPWTEVRELEGKKTQNFTRTYGHFSYLGYGNEEEDKDVYSPPSVARRSEIKRNPPLSLVVNNTTSGDSSTETEEEEEEAKPLSDTCLWCMSQVTPYDTDSHDVGNSGVVCGDCCSDLNAVEQIIDAYPELSNDPEWVGLFFDLTREDEGDKIYVH